MPNQGCLIFSSGFPPTNTVGIHRPVALCRHLAEQGWQVTVITPRPGADDVIDEGLLERVPKEVRVVRTSWWDPITFVSRVLKGGSSGGARGGDETLLRAKRCPAGGDRTGPTPLKRLVDWLSWWLHIPDRKCGWFLPALWAGLKEARRYRPAVIYSTAPMWTGHVAAAALSRLIRVPLALDFRDPWCGSAWRAIPYGPHRQLDTWLEKYVVRQASAITCATDGVRRHLATRYPERTHIMSTILNGFEPEQLEEATPVRLDGERCVLIHPGTLYGPRSPVPLFEGLRAFVRQSPEEARRLMVVFLGSGAYNGKALMEYAREFEVEPLTRIHPRVPHRQAVGILKGADVAVLFGQGGHESLAPVPAKVYEYVGLGKSILAFDAGDEALEVMQGGGCRVWRVSSDEPADCAARLGEILRAHSRGELRSGNNRQARMQYTRQRMAEQAEAVLAAVAVQAP